MAERSASEKLSHAEVGYESPTHHPNEFCALCAHFIKAKPPRCEAVKEPIRGGDWCKRFQRAK